MCPPRAFFWLWLVFCLGTARAESPSDAPWPEARPGPTVVAPSSQALTLEQAVRLGQDQSPDLRVAAEAVETAVGQYQQLKSGMRPMLQFNSGTTVQDKQSKATTRLDPVSSQISLGMQWLLTTFGQLENQIAAAFLQIDVQRANFEVTRQDLVLAVKTAFFRRLQADATLATAEANLVSTQQSLSDTNSLFAQGLMARYDVVQAELAVVEATQDVAQSRTDIGTTTVALQTVLYELGDPRVDPVPPPEITVDRTVTGSDLDRLAQQSRPEVAVLDRNLAAADALLESAYSNSYPNVSLFTGYISTVGSFVPTDVLGLTLQVQWNIFDGGLRDGAVHEAEATIRSLHAQADQLRANITSQVQTAFLNFEQTEFTLQTAVKRVETARVFYEMARERFLNGLGTSLETQTALASWISARQELVEATYEREIAFAQLERQIGIDFPNRRLAMPTPIEGAPR